MLVRCLAIIDRPRRTPSNAANEAEQDFSEKFAGATKLSSAA
jgi:hypothetical protein